MESASLKARARELGFDLVGVCDAVAAPHFAAYEAWLGKGCHGVMSYMERQASLREHPERLLPGVRSIVAVGLNYNQANPVREGYPRIARYALGRDYHRVVRGKLAKLAGWIASACPEARSRACVDSAPIFERDYARLAGLGWFGKNTCLIDSRRGSWFVLGLVLTTEHFEADEPAVGGCGTCRRCVDACPTGAIVFEEGRWQVDARKCVSYLTIEAARAGTRDEGRGTGDEGGVTAIGQPGIGVIGTDRTRGTHPTPHTPHPTPHNPTPHTPHIPARSGDDWTFGCDVCQEVCPFNEQRESQPLRAQTTREPDFLAGREWPSLVELAGIGYDEWDALTRGSAVRRAGWMGLRRNAGEGTS